MFAINKRARQLYDLQKLREAGPPALNIGGGFDFGNRFNGTFSFTNMTMAAPASDTATSLLHIGSITCDRPPDRKSVV